MFGATIEGVLGKACNLTVCVSPVLPESLTEVDLLVLLRFLCTVCVRSSAQPYPCVCVCDKKWGEREKGFTCKAGAVKSCPKEWPSRLIGI